MAQSFTPTWLPPALRQPAVGYGIAVVVQMIGVAVTLAILKALPQFAFEGLFSALGIVVTALVFGPGPSLLATVLGALLLNFVVQSQVFHFSLNTPTEVVSLLLYVLVGVAISVIAGQVERGRRVAERLAAQVSAQASQTLALQHERFTHERAAARARVEALEASRRQMDEFLGLASHELRTPLTIAMANVQIVRRQAQAAARLLSELDAQADQAPLTSGAWQTDQRAQVAQRLASITTLLERADVAMARLNRLVNDLLDATRIEAGRFTLDDQTCDLGALVIEATAEQRLVWPNRAIQVTLPESPITMQGDAKRLKQIAAIFLSNALKFAPPDRPVCLRLERVDTVLPASPGPLSMPRSAAVRADAVPSCGDAPAWARIAVSDEGPGLTIAQQAQVWDRFARIEGIERQEGSVVGIGLGLYIAQAIIERHGGRSGVESVSGVGATFWCELPLSVAAEQSAHELVAPAS